MVDSAQKRRLADLLEQVVDGKLEAADALKQAKNWSDIPWEKRDLSVALHALMHFHIDTDIRQKDPQYDEDMKHNLRLHISNLRGS